MNIKFTKTLRGFAFATLFAPAMAVHAALAVIAHPSNALAGLTADEVAMIYLGKVQSFPNGRPVVPVDQTAGNASRTKFNLQILAKDDAALKAFWSKLMFSGKGNPPPEIGDDQAVKNWVAKHPESIGYVDGSLVDSSVKVLLIVPGT